MFAQPLVRRPINPALPPSVKKQASEKSKVRPLHKKLPAKIFSSRQSGFIQEHTSIAGNKCRISFDIDLGEALITKSSPAIKGAEGKRFTTISWSNLHTGKMPNGVSYRMLGNPGEPEIPAVTIVIAVPETATNFNSSINPSQATTFENTFLLPKSNSKGEREFRQKKYDSYSVRSMYLSPVAKIRTMSFVTLTVPLAEYRAGNVEAKKKFTCGITFTIPSNFAPATKTDPVFEGLYRQTVANASDISGFRSGFHTSPARMQNKTLSFNMPSFNKSIINWIDPGAPYIKLYATRTGLYRVSSNQIASKYPDFINWHASETRMFNKGKEISVWIDSTPDGRINAVEYFGEHLPGFPGEYYNWDSDSNAYWLTNSRKFQTSPLRYTDKVVNGTPASTTSDGVVTLHHEQDNFYYGGDDTNQINTLHKTEWVPGERFVWRIIPDAQSVTDTFFIGAMPAGSSQKATFVIFLRGISTNSDKQVVHEANIFINGNNVANVSFMNFDELRDTLQIPLSMLHAGPNVFQLSYEQGSGSPDKWYFDYYSFSLAEGLSPSNDTAIARGQWDFTLSNSQSSQNISLASSEIPHLYNLTDGTRLLPTGNSASYKENSFGSNRYAGATLLSFLVPDRIDTVLSHFSASLDTSQSVDYIIITNPLFLTEAQKLAVFRQQQSKLRTKVITTDDIFNAFNFGSDEPWALRRYLQYAFDFYHGTPPAFVTLFGEGTWDPKFILNNPLQDIGSRTIHRSFVPTYGVPNSDYIFTTVEGTTWLDTSTFHIVISRIPAESPQEAEDYLNKIVQYETAAPAAWDKNFLFIAGGDPGLQASDLCEDLHAYVGDGSPLDYTGGKNTYGGLGNPPISINPTFACRTDMVNQIDITQIPVIQSAFQNGQALVYFFGHGAPNITDVQFPDVGTLHNQGLYPVMITVSCRAGAFGEPNIISLDEGFVKAANEGAIMSYGTTGFSDANYDRDMSGDIFNFMRGDSLMVRLPASGPHKLNMPQIFTTSKFIETIVVRGINFPDEGPHNNLYEYSILGDAALGFALRPEPEFNITSSDISLAGRDSVSRTVFSLSDSEITVKYTVRNFGYGIDMPVHIRISDNEPGGRQIILIDTIQSLEKIAQSGVVISLDSFAVGSNTLDIFVDFDDQFPNESNKSDNEVLVTFLVNGVSATPFFPPEGSKDFCDITKDSVHIIMLLPSSDNSSPTGIEIDFDTTSIFSSPKVFSGLQGKGLFFQQSFARSSLPSPTSNVLWWRSRIMLPSGKFSGFLSHSFSLDASGSRPEFSYSTGDQLATTIISGLKVDADGGLIIPESDTVRFEVDAQGSNNTNVVPPNTVGEIFINNIPAYTTPFVGGNNFNGIAIVELTADRSGIDSVFEFWKPPQDSLALEHALGDSLAKVVAGFSQGRGVIVLTNFQGFFANITDYPPVTAALEQLGSAKGMQGLQYFGSYAMIGKKGLAPGSAKESFGNAGQLGAMVRDTVITTGTSGLAQTPRTAIATGYGKLKWKVKNADANSTIHFIVFGVRKKDGTVDTVLKADASSGTSADLSVNPATFWNQLYIGMNFNRSSSSTLSPRMYSIELEYDPAPEFMIAGNAVSAVKDTTVQGTPVSVSYSIQNVTCVDGQNVPVQLVQTYKGSPALIASDTIKHFPGHSAITLSHQIPTTGLLGVVNLTATVNPTGTLNEQLSFNNSSSGSYLVTRDTTKPKIDLLFDGRHINSGDYVSASVKIEARLLTDNPVRITDSSSVKAVLQPLFGSAIQANFTGGQKTAGYTTTVSLPSAGIIQEALDIHKDTFFLPGRYSISALGNDATGNRSDTISTEFVVSATNGLDKVMNYPNPFKDKTWFTFLLKNGSPADVKVIVYTIAGRKIRTLYLDQGNRHAGINSIEWDGKDETGNDVANGTYIYRIVLSGTNDDGAPTSDATTERAVRSR